MKVSDYLVEFLIDKGITDVFGYPGGMVTHLMDSFNKYKHTICAHVNYHEQASSFAACGYAISQKPGVAYATSGPGATNLITGICNAYFDSIPTVFLTGQVNTYESKGDYGVRQRGFQETDIVSMVKDVTKYAVCINNAKDIRYHLEAAFFYCSNGRPGPVLLDIPMNIQREQIEKEELIAFPIPTARLDNYDAWEIIIEKLQKSKRPCILAGAGIKNNGMLRPFRQLVDQLNIPVVTSMIAFDTLTAGTQNYYGFIGSYGNRTANFILAKSDLIITIGTRLDGRQIRLQNADFNPDSKLIRIDIDEGELTNTIKQDEIQIVADLKDVIPFLIKNAERITDKSFNDWASTCKLINGTISDIDSQYANIVIKKLSEKISDDVVITTDVGQNQVWVAQSFTIKNSQHVLFSGGHGAMGYSLPAAIGAYYGTKKPVISFNGDGGIQMNLQELQFVSREKLPIKIIILNNKSLGMICHFQEMYFDSKYVQTKQEGGYTPVDFKKIAYAFDIKYLCIKEVEDIETYCETISNREAVIIEIVLPDDTYVFPKLAMNKPNQDQDPVLPRDIYNYIMEL